MAAKKKKVEEKISHTLRYFYTENRRTIEESQDWCLVQVDWDLKRVSLLNKEDTYLYRSSNNVYYHGRDIEVDFKPRLLQTVYAVVIRYADGSTFGRTEGQGMILGIYNKASKANKIAELVDKNRGTNDETYKLDRNAYFQPDYFGGMEYIDVRPVVIN